MTIDNEMGTRSIQNFWFSSITWLDNVLLSIFFAMPLVSCESVKKWPSYGQMKFWWTKRERKQNCQWYSSNCIQKFEYFVPAPSPDCRSCSHGRFDGWNIKFRSKLSEIWQFEVGYPKLKNCVRDLLHFFYFLACCIIIPSKLDTKLLLDRSPCFPLRFTAGFIQFR